MRLGKKDLFPFFTFKKHHDLMRLATLCIDDYVQLQVFYEMIRQFSVNVSGTFIEKKTRIFCIQDNLINYHD